MSGKPLALITGASGGIGEAIADELAKRGYDLVLLARSKGLLDNVARRLSDQHGVGAETLELDLAAPGAVARVSAALDGRVPHILVNNAGYGLTGAFAGQDRAKQLGMIDLNVHALTALTHAMVTPMLEAARKPSTHRRGIINIASTASFQPGPLMAVYYATKAYVLSFSEALNYELRGTGLTCLAICPGPTLTRFQETAEFSGQVLLKLMPVMSAGQVAERGMKAFFKGKAVIIPGFFNWLMARFAPITPRFVLLPMVAFMQKDR